MAYIKVERIVEVKVGDVVLVSFAGERAGMSKKVTINTFSENDEAFKSEDTWYRVGWIVDVL